MPRRHDVEITAPGAKEIRVRQVNNGGDRFLKSSLGQKLKFKTLKNQKGPVDVAQIKIRVFWKQEEGGGSEWIGPRRVGSSQTIALKSPVARGLTPPPAMTTGQPVQPPQGGGMPAYSDPNIFMPGSYVDPTSGLVVSDGTQPGYILPEEDGGFPWGWAAAGLGTVFATGTAAVVIKKKRERAGA